MYDDVNEFFWRRANLELLLRDSKQPKDKQVALGVKATRAYHTLRANLLHALHSQNGVVHELRRCFKKTYFERVSMSRVIYIFSRILIPHCVAWHALLLVAFYDDTSWRYVSHATATHAFLKLLTKIYEILPENRLLGEGSISLRLLLVYA